MILATTYNFYTDIASPVYVDMTLQNTTNSAETLRPIELIPVSSSFRTPEPGSEHDFDIFHDERRLETPQRFTRPADADYNDLNDENLHSGPTFKSIIKPISEASPSATIERTPLAYVTQESITRPRSISGLLALIASLQEELRQSKDKVAELQGEIVAYQDALYQADEDAG
ncbi:hypothetical protein ST47_g989 [Ascochyta rabiei]|uniref:Uncharacterized protein n=2 Tax=Didymella rabiei TaxID=5454 RepID=A0A163LKB2_DIDRA|nr:hypothetical protein ST47_g989 [Ascochyta rabiei]